MVAPALTMLCNPIATAVEGVVASNASTALEVLSPRLRELGQKRRALQESLRREPAPVFTQISSRVGYHSRTHLTSDAADSVVVDLGRPFRIERIALVPITVNTPIYADKAYGFPARFRIDVCDQRNFKNSVTIFDSGQVDFPNPGPFPVSWSVEEVEARFVRLTSTQHQEYLGYYFWAVGELMVFSGGVNVAAGASVLSARGPEFPPTWGAANLTEGESQASLPIVFERSPSNGWLANQKTPVMDGKWVQVDWKTPKQVQQICLVPARPTDVADTPGMGFPLIYRIEGRADEAADWQSLYESTTPAEPHNSESPVVVQIPDVELSAVRVFALDLPKVNDRTQFALAELQIYNGGDNIAFNATVTASDSFSDEQFSRWYPQALVDGYTSQFRLVKWPDYLAKTKRRSSDLQQLASVTTEFEVQSDLVVQRAGYTATLVIVTLIVSAIVSAVRLRWRRKHASLKLREQIAGDLHDDVGSNLGGIALLSEVCCSREDIPDMVREDLREIQQIAQASSEAMRDIVWLVATPQGTLHDLVLRMRSTLRRIAGVHAVAWNENLDQSGERRVTLQLRRNILLAFKEAVHNAIRHSQAERIEVSVRVENRRFTFEVSDNGQGFEVDRAKLGLGIKNLKRRAEELRGDCQFYSAPHQGTRITFQVPL